MKRLPSKFSPPPALALPSSRPNQPPRSPRGLEEAVWQGAAAVSRILGLAAAVRQPPNPPPSHPQPPRLPPSPQRGRGRRGGGEARTRYNDAGRCCAVFLARQVDMSLTCANVGCWLEEEKGVKAWRTREAPCARLPRFQWRLFRVVSGK